MLRPDVVSARARARVLISAATRTGSSSWSSDPPSSKATNVARGKVWDSATSCAKGIIRSVRDHSRTEGRSKPDSAQQTTSIDEKSGAVAYFTTSRRTARSLSSGAVQRDKWPRQMGLRSIGPSVNGSRDANGRSSAAVPARTPPGMRAQSATVLPGSPERMLSKASQGSTTSAPTRACPSAASSRGNPVLLTTRTTSRSSRSSSPPSLAAWPRSVRSASGRICNRCAPTGRTALTTRKSVSRCANTRS